MTLTSAVLYLTIALHTQNRATQASLLRQQRQVLAEFYEPKKPEPEPANRVVPVGLAEMAKDRWNGPLDLEHLAEEIEDVGSERRYAVRSQLRRIIEHLLKLEHSRARDPRSGWQDLILDARAEIADRMTSTIRREVENERR